jgi:NADH:ubiquinone oxidoreductase subunit 3 (subunit A)
MTGQMLLSPPVAVCIFLALATGLYGLGAVLAAPGEEHPGKHQPYACGEDIVPRKAQLSYHAFFRMVLMFGVLHLSALVVSTLPARGASHRIAIVYLVGIAISASVLTKGEV